ncbi:cbb3-type cytochrome oxidase maturation protein [Altererythrobacter atlanticus]|uniref:Cytochrome oxidase maturation protein cbb3-type n=1 Tax=Croceibacterium atlanticum TaxID=1267766 RepID=A0A0F7KX54_9SPHN|nr:cbb3-type cytochrome oxidase assembly protein CcoS [Croceibacterium atlanticum]AKH43781.1 Cytochrome oxidase maturation protein cbb3-type [Croceibacterium atlanticum]MBB5733770.1 cbb3-type cytochrome oxidase maturation protein [Croceibacterium atlanticum]
MRGLIFLIPIALILGALGLASFFWALRNGQFEDPEGSAARILMDEDDDRKEDKDEDRYA